VNGSPSPGTVVVIDFPGVATTKRRPALVVSTDLYHANRPDLILGLLTSEVAQATGPTDYGLQDWAAAGLHQASWSPARRPPWCGQ
jgi:mRNA interferase MazF